MLAVYDAAIVAFTTAPICIGAVVAIARNTTWRYRRVGGIRFLRVWRFQMSVCLCKPVTA
jgi:hypothetical protein